MPSKIVPEQSEFGPYWLVSPYGLGFNCYVPMGEGPWTWNVFLGTYEGRKTKILQDNLKPGMTFLDIGANFGYFSFLAQEFMGGQGRVIAFEPYPENVHWLERGISENPWEIEVLPFALSDYYGEAEFFLSRHNGAHSLLPTGFSPTGRSVEVPVSTLDSVAEELGIEDPDFIKVDVEGAEGKVFLGGQKFLRECRKTRLLIDLHPHCGAKSEEDIALLEWLGFVVLDIYGKPISDREKAVEVLAYKPEAWPNGPGGRP